MEPKVGAPHHTGDSPPQAPVITPFEAELAFRPGAVWDPSAYSTGFPAALAAPEDTGEEQEPEFSLISGAYRKQLRRPQLPGGSGEPDGAAHELALRAEQALAVASTGSALQDVTSAAAFLHMRRSFQACESPQTHLQHVCNTDQSIVSSQQQGLVPTPRTEGDHGLEPAQGLKGRAAVYSDEHNY